MDPQDTNSSLDDPKKLLTRIKLLDVFVQGLLSSEAPAQWNILWGVHISRGSNLTEKQEHQLSVSDIYSIEWCKVDVIIQDKIVAAWNKDFTIICTP